MSLFSMAERAGIEPAPTRDFNLVLFFVGLPLYVHLGGAIGFDQKGSAISGPPFYRKNWFAGQARIRIHVFNNQNYL